MATYEKTSVWAKRIRDKYGREPNIYLSLGEQKYEDMEYIRSYMYENGEMNVMKTPQKIIDSNTRKARALQARNYRGPMLMSMEQRIEFIFGKGGSNED